jgi:hypothetical protein
LLLVQRNNHFKHSLVFLVIFSERKELDEYGEDVVERDVVGMSLDHASDTAGRVVEETCFLLLVQEGLELGEDGVVLADDLGFVGALLAQKTSAVGGVAADFWILVSETLEQQLHQTGSVGCNGSTHVANSLGDGANSSAALVLLLSADVLDNGLLEDLPELAEGLAEGGGKAGDDLHGSLDDQPVVLGRLQFDVEFVLAVKVLLADVSLLQNREDHLDDLLNGGSGVLANVGGKDSGTAKLEGSGEVTVDVGDGTTVGTTSVIASILEKEHLCKRRQSRD